MENEILVDDVLLVKYFAGEATPDEAMTIHNWVESSKQNQLLFAEMESAWALGRSVKAAPQVELVWKNIQATIGKQEGKKTISFGFSYKIAAAILLPVSVSLALYFYTTSTQSADLAWETKETSTEVANLNLPDGSSVTVNRNSRVRYPKGLAGNSREVILTGEGFFDVAHNAEKPFIITTDAVKVKVLGTAFNVSDVEPGTITTEVVRGKVMMYTEENQIIIEAGMKGVYNRKTKELSIVKLKNENDIAYATHTLSFESATMKEICDQLAKAYGVEFVFENEHVQHCTLTSEYHNQSLSFIMSVIAESLEIKYEIKGNTVHISGDGCL